MGASCQGQPVPLWGWAKRQRAPCPIPACLPRPSSFWGIAEHLQVTPCTKPNLLPATGITAKLTWIQCKWAQRLKYKDNAMWCWCIFSSEFEVRKKWREKEKCEDILRSYLVPSWTKEEYSLLCQIELQWLLPLLFFLLCKLIFFFSKTFLPLFLRYRLKYKQIDISKNSNLYSTLNKLVYIQKRFLDQISFRTENLHISFFLKNEEAMRSIPTMYCSNRLPQSTHDFLNTEAVVLVFSKKKLNSSEKWLLSRNRDKIMSLKIKWFYKQLYNPA